MLENLPILGVCGRSRSGKTTLIEQALPALRGRGLDVAAVKHAGSGVEVDRPGADSDRLFQAGADVLLQGPREQLLRAHGSRSGPPAAELSGRLCRLARGYDLVLVEGHKSSSIAKIWLLSEGETSAPSGVPNVLDALAPGEGRPDRLLRLLDHWLVRQWLKTPVFGCVLIGGKSTRMGRPKHLITAGRKTWLQRAVERLQDVCGRVAVGPGQREAWC